MDKNLKELIEYPKEGIISKNIFKEEGLNVGLFCMAKGTDMSDHTSTKKATIYVLEGDGIFNLKGKDIVMKPGVFIFMEENDVHSLKANENTTFILSLFENKK